MQKKLDLHLHHTHHTLECKCQTTMKKKMLCVVKRVSFSSYKFVILQELKYLNEIQEMNVYGVSIESQYVLLFSSICGGRKKNGRKQWYGYLNDEY